MDSLQPLRGLYASGRYREARECCRARVWAAMHARESDGAPTFVTVLEALTIAGLSSIAMDELDQAWIDLHDDMRDHCRALTGRGLESVIGEIAEPGVRQRIAHGQARLVELTIAELEPSELVGELAARALRVARGARVPLAVTHAGHQMLRTIRYLGRHEHAAEGWRSLACIIRARLSHGDPVPSGYPASRSLAEAVATLHITASHSPTYAQLARQLRRVAREVGDVWAMAVADHLGPTAAPTAEASSAPRSVLSADAELHRLRTAAWFDALREPGAADVEVYLDALAGGPLASRLYYPWQSLLRRRRYGVVPTELCAHLDRLLATFDSRIVAQLGLPKCSFDAYLRPRVLARIICL
ncbi:hypothetical protein ENSA5_49400 [Enhygromyxa salina]|uniref:Uncharacterized protein n=1 Tax=Enhygromyxa salina TaxID=215803 RepID=A0A2S9XHU6_9BACT|nr:hypothetical protein [Enhygromyxa salina]PRP92432.1 hypothetical protein ENSA5_49400 [Enhygromyxa salina]